jgi:hypothetical protein
MQHQVIRNDCAPPEEEALALHAWVLPPPSDASPFDGLHTSVRTGLEARRNDPDRQGTPGASAQAA